MPDTFSLIGYGRVAQRHVKAIEAIGGEIVSISDPAKGHTGYPLAGKNVVICTPSADHLKHIKLALDHDKTVIVEKPACMPWEQLPDSDNVNAVLQYRYLPELDGDILVRLVRPPEYFDGWQGDERQTGGLWYHLLIHYVDLAIERKKRLTFEIVTQGKQERLIGATDLDAIPTDGLYEDLYRDAIKGAGIHPRDIAYLHHVLNDCRAKYGDGADLINRQITLDFRPGLRVSDIHPTAWIDARAYIYNGTKVWHNSHIQNGATIWHDCTIGQNVNIGPYVEIGARCRIQNNVSIFNGALIESDVFIGPGVTFTNVRKPNAYTKAKGHDRICVQRGAVIGAGAVIVAPCVIGEDAFIAAGAVVTRNVRSGERVMGVPAKSTAERITGAI